MAVSACTQGSAPRTRASASPLIELGQAGEVTLVAGTNDNLVVPFANSTFLDLSPDPSGSTVTGIKTDAEQDEAGNYLGPGVSEGQTFIIRNTNLTLPILFTNNSTSSLLNYRVDTGLSTDFTLAPGHVVWITCAFSGWRLLVQ